MIRALLAALLVTVAIQSATAAERSAQRAATGAGWSPVTVEGNSGQQIFRRYCWECHGDGPDRPGTDALQAKYKGAISARLDRRSDLSASVIVYVVRHGISVMPSMRKTEISDAELQAIAAYLARKKD